MANERRNRIAQWAFDTRPILGRFHLWLEDVDITEVSGDGSEAEGISFVPAGLERCFITMAGVTALGTRLFGRWGEGKGLPKEEMNRVKKDADAISAYAMSEGLWYLTRNLPENHAVMVSLGEGLMPKAGETPEMGSNPLLGFGRVYARPQVARFLDRQVTRLINDPEYGWEDFWGRVNDAGLTIWGAAIDTLENTSRFAKGSESGPMTVFHLFDQPLEVALPYEGYTGVLTLPARVVNQAAERSTLIQYQTPRQLVLNAIRRAYPDVEPERVHVWTLGGAHRDHRLGTLWREWKELGVHLVEDGWKFPDGAKAFTESGTYAPTWRVGPFTGEDGKTHFFLIDGYAASAEAIQAAGLDPALDLRTSMCIFSSKFEAPVEKEREIMRLDPDADDFAERLSARLGREAGADDLVLYRNIIDNAAAAGMPLERPAVIVDDFFPKKRWQTLAVAGCMLDDPYTGAEGVCEVAPDTYRVTTRAASRGRVVDVALTLRFMDPEEQKRRLVFSPLLDRFYAGADYQERAVKISDSGRIRNELMTLASEALEHFGEGGIRVHFDRIDDAVLSPDKRRLIREVLEWYKANHPIWFTWLEIA
jgi:hypothetical protein